jgi:uncharacterized protein (DUF433 family)
MQLDDYFEFLSPEEIRIKGTRIGIEHILYEYIYAAKTPEAIARHFHTVTLAQVYATILYYLENKEVVSKYVGEWLEYCLKAEAEYDRNPSPFARKLRKIKERQKAAKPLEVINDN